MREVRLQENLVKEELLRREKRGRCPSAFGKDKYSSAGAGDLRNTRYEVLPCGPFCMQVIDFSWLDRVVFEFPFINPVAAIRFDFFNEQGDFWHRRAVRACTANRPASRICLFCFRSSGLLLKSYH